MNKVIALVDLHSNDDLGLLTKNRPIASTTILGRYAFIDCALSNLSNSGIDKVGILIKDHFRSIVKHISSSATYLSNPKIGFQSYFVNEKGMLNPKFNTDIANIKENDWFLYDNDIKYVIVCPCNYLMKIDYNAIIDEHIRSGKLVSLVVKDSLKAGEKCAYGIDKVIVDSLGNIQKFESNDMKSPRATLSLETYVFNVEFLRAVLSKVDTISSMYSINDFVRYISSYIEKVHAIYFQGLVRRFSSLQDYYDYSFEIMEYPKLREICSPDWTYYTTTHDTRPTLYGVNAEVKDSFIANGCTINGKVSHSIFARKVIVEDGASVEDCIIFTDTKICSGVHVKNAIIDKHCIIRYKTDVGGEKDNPLYIPQGAHI